jgi:transposase-like protein
VKLGFKNFYLYSAVNAKSGDSFSYLYSKVDTDCFNHFLQEFSQEHQGKEIIMIMDGAGWHKSHNLKMPKNIQKVFLPPYWACRKTKFISKAPYKIPDIQVSQ